MYSESESVCMCVCGVSIIDPLMFSISRSKQFTIHSSSDTSVYDIIYKLPAFNLGKDSATRKAKQSGAHLFHADPFALVTCGLSSWF